MIANVRKLIPRGLVGATLPLLAFVALSSSGARATCSSDRDCKGDRICVNGRCGSASQSEAPAPAPSADGARANAPDHPAGAPPSFIGTRVTFGVGRFSGDVKRFHVAVTAEGLTFQCDSNGLRPCSLQLPQGRAHAHFDLVLENDDTETMDESFRVGTTPEIATPSYSNHHGRFVGGFLLYGAAVVGLYAIDLGLAVSVLDPGTGLGIAAVGAGATLTGVILGTIFVAKGPHHEDLEVDAATMSPDESEAPVRAPAFALRGIGVAPLPGGGGTIGASFAF